MTSITAGIEHKPWVPKIARIGLIAKGIVYVILGALAFMAAFEIGGQSNQDTNKAGVFNSIKDFPGGIILLVLLAAGLVCYSIWRMIQTFSGHDPDVKLSKRVRYFFSGVIYLLLAGTAVQMIVSHEQENGDGNQHLVARMLDHPAGEWIIGTVALMFAAVGIYQIYYAVSEKYKKHVEQLNGNSNGASALLKAGKVGYISRGIVWLLLAYLFLMAALHSNSSEAGGTSKAFQSLESSSYGSYLLGALGLGLVAYGVFNFIRAKYQRDF